MLNKFISFALFALFAFSCTVEEQARYVKGNPDDVKPVQKTGDNTLIDTRVFNIINLDYPGMEAVKECHSAGNEYGAAAALLDYYRGRGTVDNIFVDLLSPLVNEAEISMANQASKEGGYRFYVRNYQQSDNGDNGYPQYWSFAAGDGGINWDFTPEGIVDQEWGYQKQRLQWMLTQAMVYKSTSDEKYIKAWIDIYGNWMKTFPCPEGKVASDNIVWFDLQVSERLRDLLSVFEYYKQSVNFTPEWLSKVLCSIYDHTESIKNNPYGDETSNHRLAQYQSLTMSGILMPEFKGAGSWLDYGAKGISSSLKTQFNEDGVHNELDPSYHTGVLDDFIGIYKLAKANGKLDKFPSDYVSCLHKAARFVMDIVYPDYTIDNYNDTRSGSSFTKRVTLRNLRSYSSMFPEDNELLYTSSEGLRGKEPSSDPAIYPVSGYYMFRNGWNTNSMMLVLKNNYNPHNKWHCQPDNGTVCLWNRGRRFLPDAGVFSYGGTYETNKLREAYRSTNMHNTLMKGTQSIADGFMKGVFNTSGKGDGYEYVVSSNDSYADLSHRRAVFFVDKTFFVVVDEGYGQGSGFTVNLSWNLCAGKDDVVIDDAIPGAYGAHTVFSDGNNMLFRTFTETAEAYAASNSTNYYSDVINQRTQRRYYRVGIAKQPGLAARYITVIAPFKDETEFAASDISAEFSDNTEGVAGTFHEKGVSLKVKFGKKTYKLSYKL